MTCRRDLYGQWRGQCRQVVIPANAGICCPENRLLATEESGLPLERRIGDSSFQRLRLGELYSFYARSRQSDRRLLRKESVRFHQTSTTRTPSEHGAKATNCLPFMSVFQHDYMWQENRICMPHSNCSVNVDYDRPGGACGPEDHAVTVGITRSATCSMMAICCVTSSMRKS